MKIEKLNEDNFIVFLNKLYLNNNEIELKKDFEIYFKKLFKVLNDFYNIEISGYYDIIIYCDKIYGYILDIKKEHIDFYDYYDDHIDMKITINYNQKFVFKINDYSVLDEVTLNYCHVVKDKKTIYLMPKKTINQYALGNLIENSTIIYGDSAQIIVRKSKDVKTKQVFVWKNKIYDIINTKKRWKYEETSSRISW